MYSIKRIRKHEALKLSALLVLETTVYSIKRTINHEAKCELTQLTLIHFVPIPQMQRSQTQFTGFHTGFKLVGRGYVIAVQNLGGLLP